MDIVSVVKEHPIPIIGAGVLLALLLMRGGGSNGASSAYAASLQAQDIATNGNVKLASISAQESAARAGYTADMYRASIAASVAGRNSDTAVLSHFMDHLDNQTAFANDLAEKQASIASSTMLGAKSLENQLQIHLNDNATKLDGLTRSLATQSGTTQYLATLTAQNLPTILHSQETIAGINATSAQQMAVINGQTMQAVASINTDASRTVAQAQKNKSDWGIVGDLASSFFSLF